MKALVLGGNGFLGRHISAAMRDEGWLVSQVDREHGDLRVPGEAAYWIKNQRPDVVVHLAAKVGRQFGENDPMETVIDNAGMTALVAQACGRAGVPLVYASTSEVYGDNGEVVCNEAAGPYRLPHNLYGLSKRWGEEVCELYAPAQLRILRFSMPYGPGLPYGKGRAAIVNMLWQAETRQPIPVHEGAERCWCWVGDTARGVVSAVRDGEPGVYNVGRDDNPTSMLEVARIACSLTGASESLIEMVSAPANQTVVKRLSTSRLRRLGWEPQVELQEGMRMTLSWVRQVMSPGAYA